MAYGVSEVRGGGGGRGKEVELKTSRAMKSGQIKIVLLCGLKEALIKVVCSSTRMLFLVAQVNNN